MSNVQRKLSSILTKNFSLIHSHSASSTIYTSNLPGQLAKIHANTASQIPQLSWSEFFRLRRRIQVLQRISGVPFAFGFLSLESAVLSLPIFDPTKTVFGMDPLIAVGLATIGGTIISYLGGFILGGFVWKRFRPDLAKQLNERQRNFYARVIKYRANVPPNPTQINFNFDYYGEKVRSISDYRQWLRRQYQLKRERG